MANFVQFLIPEELEQYKKAEISDEIRDIPGAYSNLLFNIKTVSNKNGIDYVAYYNQTGEIVKQEYYRGSLITKINKFTNNKLKTSEQYDNGNVIEKQMYDSDEKVVQSVKYLYQKEKIICITKTLPTSEYSINYGYDELDRVNYRKITVNDIIFGEQHYRFDILDRTIEYKDYNQKITVHQVNNKNQLLSYTITDSAGNEINVQNTYIDTGYVSSDISVNGHVVTVADSCYADNVMLKRPYAKDDDIDLVISQLFSARKTATERKLKTIDITEYLIGKNLKTQILPISIRKHKLCGTVVNS